METHFRSITKAISYRAGGTIVTCVVAWVITRNFDLAAQIGVIDTILKIAVFYVHERLWNRSNFGKHKPPDYQI